MENKTYDILLPNGYGRKYTKRYKQYCYSDIEELDGIPNWELQNFGCGITSIATIIASLGFNEDPVSLAKRMLLDREGNPLDFYTNRGKGRLGLSLIGFIYLLQELADIYPIEYRLLKFSYEHPELKKCEVLERIREQYMALILVGPNGKVNHPRTFSNYGHYIAVTSVDERTDEFYVANPNKLGDSQVDETYSYETLVANMYSNTFDFLMIGRKNEKLLQLR